MAVRQSGPAPESRYGNIPSWQVWLLVVITGLVCCQTWMFYQFVISRAGIDVQEIFPVSLGLDRSGGESIQAPPGPVAGPHADLHLRDLIIGIIRLERGEDVPAGLSLGNDQRSRLAHLLPMIEDCLVLAEPTAGPPAPGDPGAVHLPMIESQIKGILSAEQQAFIAGKRLDNVSIRLISGVNSSGRNPLVVTLEETLTRGRPVSDSVPR